MSLMLKIALAGVFISMTFAMEKPCCVSKKFFGRMKIVTTILKNGSSVPVITENKVELDYDYDMKMDRVMGEIFTDDGGKQNTLNYSTINDYRNMRSYRLYMGSCTVETLDSSEDMTPPCVPSTLTLEGNFTYGSGAEALHVNSWSGMVDNFMYSMQTSVNDCTPVSMTRFGVTPEGDRISESALYVDVIQYQVRADAFKVPDACMTAYSFDDECEGH